MLALTLLADPRLDALLAPPIAFARLPQAMDALLDRQSDVMCPVIAYR